MTVKAENAAELVANTVKRFPDAVRLARTVSLASRIEPELLRQARLRLLPGIPAGAEADLWFSPLVQSATPLAITLFPAVADLLRRELAKSPETLQRAWDLLNEIHQNAPAAIRLEERVTFETLAGGDGSLERVENELMSVVSAISEQKRSGLARWALRAVPRLPEAARQTQAATTLVLTAAEHLDALHLLDQQIESKTLSAGFINQLQIVLPSDLPRVLVGVRLLENWGPESDRRYLVEFSYPPLLELSVIGVPATVPLMLEVSWNDSSQEQVRNLNLYQGRTETVAVGANTVSIRTAGGDIYTLREEANENVQAVINATGASIPAAPSIGYITRRYSTGRDIAESVKAELAPGRKRLVQMWGPGGAGKTVIASHVALELLDAFNQRVIWKSAEGRSDFNINTLLDGIAFQLGRNDLWTLNIKEKERQVKAMLSASPTLIFIDDFEVIEPKFRTRILNFLRKSEAVTLIISRRRIDGVYHVVIGRMLLEEGTEFLTRIIRQKKSTVFAGFDLIRIAEACDSNPLAMRLLVAQVNVTDNVQEALAGIGKGKANAVTRVLNSSFNLPQLGDDGRKLLKALALFVPDASVGALYGVVFESDVQRYDKPLKVLERLELININGERISITGTVRQFLLARFGKSSKASQVFMVYFLFHVKKHTEFSEDYDAIEAEFENVLDAMDIAVKSKSWDSVIGFGRNLSNFFYVRGYWDEALRRNQQAERAARIRRLNDVVLQLKQVSADIYLRRREFNKAKRIYEFLLSQYRNIPDEAGVARVTRRLGSIALEQDRLNEAERLYSEALKISRELRSNEGIADNLHNLAIVAQEKGDLTEARRLYLESLELSGSLNDDRSVAISLHQLGVIALENGNYDEADQFLRQSLEKKRKLQDRSGIADTLHQLGLLCKAQGKIQEAEQLLREALGIFSQLGSPSAREVQDDLARLLTYETHSFPVTEKTLAVSGPVTNATTKRPAGKSGTKSGLSSRPKKPSKKRTKHRMKGAKKGAQKRFEPRMGGASSNRRYGARRFKRAASAKAYK